MPSHDSSRSSGHSEGRAREDGEFIDVGADDFGDLVDPSIPDDDDYEDGAYIGEDGEDDDARGGDLVVDGREGRATQAAAQALAQPLAELAKAFSFQSEILKGIHDQQKKIGEVIKDEKRSDMMINSTRNLNDTFRGLRNAQEAMLDRLEETEKGKRVWRLAAIAGVLLTVGSALWGVVTLKRTRDQALAEAPLEMKGRLASLENVVTDQKDELGELRDERNRLSRAQADLQGRLDNIKKAETNARTELGRLRNSKEKATSSKSEMNRKVRQLESEINFYVEKYQDVQQENKRLMDQVLAQLNTSSTPQKDIESLLGSGAALVGRDRPIVGGNDLRDEGDVVNPPGNGGRAATSRPTVRTPNATNPNNTINSNAGPTTPNPTRPRASGGTNSGNSDTSKKPAVAGTVGDAVRTVNKLLGNHLSDIGYKLKSVGKVAKGHLEKVVFEEVHPRRGVIRQVEADRMFFDATPLGQQIEVELTFRKGTVRHADSKGTLGPARPFYNDVYYEYIHCKNPNDWRAQRRPWIALR